MTSTGRALMINSVWRECAPFRCVTERSASTDRSVSIIRASGHARTALRLWVAGLTDIVSKLAVAKCAQQIKSVKKSAALTNVFIRATTTKIAHTTCCVMKTQCAKLRAVESFARPTRLAFLAPGASFHVNPTDRFVPIYFRFATPALKSQTVTTSMVTARDPTVATTPFVSKTNSVFARNLTDRKSVV